MIKILDEKKPKKASKPYYVLVYNYMIGDGDGHTNEEVELSVDNPYIERYVTLLNSLKPLKDSWGVGLDRCRLYEQFDEGQITKDDYSFLNRLMFDGEDEDDDDWDDDDDDWDDDDWDEDLDEIDWGNDEDEDDDEED